jgi:RHS repeat-associated protein
MKAGLNWYDYGARHYDAALGRFTTQDPLAKDFYATSPYGYCLNNPMKYIDPDGKDARISIQGNTITITSNIVLTGSMATEQLAQAYQKNIMDNWGKLTTYKYNDVVYDIVWDVNVRAAKEGESLVHDGTNNFLEVTNYVSKIKFTTNQGEIRGVGWAGKSFDETNPMSHEFGHILGLKDKYKKIKMENGKYDYITLKGWQNNIMGEYSGEGKVEYKNLDYILPNVIHHFNLFENLTDIAPWTEYYFINGNNREK